MMQRLHPENLTALILNNLQGSLQTGTGMSLRGEA